MLSVGHYCSLVKVKWVVLSLGLEAVVVRWKQVGLPWDIGPFSAPWHCDMPRGDRHPPAGDFARQQLHGAPGIPSSPRKLVN